MTEPTIACPKCGTEIPLTAGLAAPLVDATRREYEARLQEKDLESARREEILREREQAAEHAIASADETLAARLLDERRKIVEEESQRAKQRLTHDLEQKDQQLLELNELLSLRDVKLAEAQQEQAVLLRKQRELDDAKRELDLTIEKRVQEGLGSARDEARREAEDQLKQKVQERERTIASMQSQIEELKRRSEQGSQQLQGEVLELELETLLRQHFPGDAIDPVAKGDHGGDVLHRVIGPLGQASGTILWECKRTKNWSDGWLIKLRDDQRSAKAEICVLVSHALPKGVESFAHVDSVWIAHPRVALPLATALRQSLVELALARQSIAGQQTKTEMVYEYLTGPRFRQRVEAIVEAFSSMRADLEREKRAIMKQWSKRDEQLSRVMQATVGMYGDLQGIAGQSFQEIRGVGMAELESPSSTEFEGGEPQ